MPRKRIKSSTSKQLLKKIYKCRYITTSCVFFSGKVLVSSEMGISRSAVLVVAYLMIDQMLIVSETLFRGPEVSQPKRVA